MTVEPRSKTHHSAMRKEELEAEAEAEAATANTSKTTMVTTTETVTRKVTIRDTSSRLRMRAGEEAKDHHQGGTRHRIKTTRREEDTQTAQGAVIRGRRAAEDGEA